MSSSICPCSGGRVRTPSSRPSSAVEQFVDAASAHRDGRDDGHAEFARQQRGIEFSPSRLAMSIMLSAITIGRPSAISSSAKRRCFSRFDASTTTTIASGQPLALLLPGHDVAGDLLVGASRAQAVGAGQVDHFDRAAVGQRQPARHALDGDAGIIADLLPRAGERVEQRALARIGIADERDQRRAVVIPFGTLRQDADRPDRARRPSAAAHRHAADPAGERPAAQRRAVEHLDRRRPRRSRVRAAGAPRAATARPSRSRRRSRTRAQGADWREVHVSFLRLIINNAAPAPAHRAQTDRDSAAGR